MKKTNLFYIIFILFVSCTEKIDKEKIVAEINNFSGLKINNEYIDSISYDYDFAIGDEGSIYILYIEKYYFDSIMRSKIKNNINFIHYNDSISNFSETKANCLKQITINYNKNLIAYSIDCD